MAHLGLLLACEHYPALPAKPGRLDGQLHHWLGALGHDIDRISRFDCHLGMFPASGGQADLWIVSGQVLDGVRSGRDIAGELMQFLKAAAALGRPVYGLYHGEIALHRALAEIGAPPPGDGRGIRAIRNPFQSFQSRDRLFAFHAATRRVVELQRPEALTRRAMFRWRQAA